MLDDLVIDHVERIGPDEVRVHVRVRGETHAWVVTRHHGPVEVFDTGPECPRTLGAEGDAMVARAAARVLREPRR